MTPAGLLKLCSVIIFCRPRLLMFTVCFQRSSSSARDCYPSIMLVRWFLGLYTLYALVWLRCQSATCWCWQSANPLHGQIGQHMDELIWKMYASVLSKHIAISNSWAKISKKMSSSTNKDELSMNDFCGQMNGQADRQAGSGHLKSSS